MKKCRFCDNDVMRLVNRGHGIECDDKDACAMRVQTRGAFENGYRAGIEAAAKEVDSYKAVVKRAGVAVGTFSFDELANELRRLPVSR